MGFRLAADLVLLLHAAFVVFAVLGGLLVVRRRRWAWLHLPAAVWAALIELAGWICPLTPLENYFRRRAGAEGYEGGFIEHYVWPVIYPEGLTREHQLWIGGFVVALNVAIYGWVWWSGRAKGVREL